MTNTSTMHLSGITHPNPSGHSWAMPERPIMQADQLVDWTADPSLAISATGRVLAVNDACATLMDTAAASLVGQACCDVVRATDAAGARVCDPDQCATLASLAAGTSVPLEWCGWNLPEGGSPVLRATTIAVPRGERVDDVAAVILLHLDPPTVGVATDNIEPRGAAKASRVASSDAAQLSPATDGVRIHLFGRPACWRDGMPQLIRRRRVFELLALLALAGDTGIYRDQIVTTLWPEAPRGNGRQHLRVLLHALRSALGPEAVETVLQPCATESVLRLRADVWVDVLRFQVGVSTVRHAASDDSRMPEAGLDRLQELDQLIGLYRGELDEGGQFGEWIAPHREQARTQFLGLLAEAVPLAATLGQVEQAIAYCRRAIMADPLEERFQIAMITTYGRLGQRSAALAQYREYRRILASELAMEPTFAVECAFRAAVGALDAYQ